MRRWRVLIFSGSGRKFSRAVRAWQGRIIPAGHAMVRRRVLLLDLAA